MEMKVYLKEAGDSTAQWIDITERTARPSVKLTEGFSTEGKTEDASELTLTIRALNLTDAASFHTSEKLVRLVIDGSMAFEGYSDGKATVDMGISSSFVHVKVSFSSYMALLEDAKAPAGGVVYEGRKIFDPADKQNSLVHLLADAMYQNIPEEYQAELSSQTERVTAAANVQACQKTLPIVYIPEDECIFDTFQTILYENGYSFYFRSKQIEILAPWDTERTASQCVLQDFISKPTLKQQPLRHRTHLALSIASYTSQDNATLYDSGDPNSDEGKPEVIEPKKAYPEDREPQGLDYSNPDDEEAEIVYSVDPELSYTCVQVDDSAEDYDDWGTDPAPVKVTEDIRPEEGSVLFENENDYRIGIQRYRVTADKAWWKKYSITVKDSIKEGDEEEYEADYIPDTEAGEAFVAMYHLQEYANNAEITLSTELMNLVPGQLVQVTELPYKLLVLSRQTTYDNPGKPLYKYSMIPIVYIETPTDVTHTSSGGSSALRYIFLELSSVYFHYDSEGSLAPADQVIYAQVTRVNVQSTPIWMINGQAATPVEGNPDRLMISPSHMEGRQVITVSVQCGRFSKALTIAKVQDGSGGNPIQFFQWGESNTKQPDDVSEILVWGDLAITINGWALVTNPGEWEKEVPTDHPEDKPYLWCRFWNYQTEDWSYYVMNGSPAVGFTLDITPQTYRLTSRGYTKAGQTVRAICRKQNTNGVAVWSVSDSRVTLQETPDGLGPDDITLTIPEMVQMQSFELTCSIAVIGLTKTHTIGGIQEGKEETEYIGIYQSVDSLPEMIGEGEVIVGDHAVVEDAQGNRTPYYYNGSQWVMADGNTPAELAWKILRNVLYDATTSPATQQTLSVVDLFAQNFAAINAFIENLCAQILRIDGAIYGGDYKANGDWIGPDSTDPKQANGGQGFHLSKDGLLQATFAKLFNVEINSVDGGGRTVLKTYGSKDTDSFDYIFNVTPTCFRLNEPGRPVVNTEYLHAVEYSDDTAFSGKVASVCSGEGMISGGGSGLKITVPQSCTLGIYTSGGTGFNSRDSDETSNLTVSVYVNGVYTQQYVNFGAIDGQETKYTDPAVIMPLTALEEGDEISLRLGAMDLSLRLQLDFYVQFNSSLENAFASVSNPDMSWQTSTDGNPDVFTFNLRCIRASSAGQYINIGSATVSGVDIQYVDYDSGIISGLAARVKDGNRYLAVSGSTLKWNGTTKSVTEVYKTGTSYAFVLSDGSNVYISDTHTACSLELHVASQPSYVDVYRLTVSDPNGMIGTSSQPVPNIYADYFRGRLTMASFAGYGTASSTTRPSVPIASSWTLMTADDSGKCYVTNLSGTLEIASIVMKVYSDGFAEIRMYIWASDDSYAKIDLPLEFVNSGCFVEASGFRVAMMLPDSGNAPGMAGGGHDAQFDAYFLGWATPTGSGHQWTRIIAMNDYSEISGTITVTGMIDQTMYNDIISHGGSLGFLFDATAS